MKLTCEQEKKKNCWSDTFYLKCEWAQRRGSRARCLGTNSPLSESETLGSWRYTSGCWSRERCTPSWSWRPPRWKEKQMNLDWFKHLRPAGCSSRALLWCWGWRSAGCVNNAASGWCCRRSPVCSGAVLPPPDAYEDYESHTVSACGGKHGDSDQTMQKRFRLTAQMLTSSLRCPCVPAGPGLLCRHRPHRSL